MISICRSNRSFDSKMHVMVHAPPGSHCCYHRAPHGGTRKQTVLVHLFLHTCRQSCHMRGSVRMSQVLICSQDKSAWWRKGQRNKACWCPAAALLLVLTAFSLFLYHLCYTFYSPRKHTHRWVFWLVSVHFESIQQGGNTLSMRSFSYPNFKTWMIIVSLCWGKKRE